MTRSGDVIKEAGPTEVLAGQRVLDGDAFDPLESDDDWDQQVEQIGAALRPVPDRLAEEGLHAQAVPAQHRDQDPEAGVGEDAPRRQPMFRRRSRGPPAPAWLLIGTIALIVAEPTTRQPS